MKIFLVIQAVKHWNSCILRESNNFDTHSPQKAIIKVCKLRNVKKTFNLENSLEEAVLKSGFFLKKSTGFQSFNRAFAKASIKPLQTL